MSTVSPRLVLASDADFPPSLATAAPRPVQALWVSGRLPATFETSLAIVGSRAASGAGCDTAWQLARDLGQVGRSIVSGGALGIDAAAHQGALAAGAATYAVLGCGIDVVYPDRHAALYARVSTQGALLSEYGPGVPPRPGRFPVRNRIIVALAQAVIVVEAAPRSGALVTARLCRQRGRLLLAVPGSSGTDRLIARREAVPVRDADDVLAVLAGGAGASTGASAAPPGIVADVLAAVAAGHDDVRTLVLALARPVGEVLAALGEAELEGWLLRGPGNRYEVSRGSER